MELGKVAKENSNLIRNWIEDRENEGWKTEAINYQLGLIANGIKDVRIHDSSLTLMSKLILSRG